MKSSDLFVFVSQATGLHFRHTDNVIQWLNAMSEKGLPKVSVAHQLRFEMRNNVDHSSSCDEKHKTQSLRHSESFKWKKNAAQAPNVCVFPTLLTSEGTQTGFPERSVCLWGLWVILIR